MNQVTITAEAFSKALHDAAAFGRGNLEALAQSAQAYVQGTQDLGRQAFTLAQDLNTQAVEGAKALTEAKSLKEAADVQARFARTTLERAAKDTIRLQQAALQVVERAFAPLAGRAKAAVAQTTRRAEATVAQTTRRAEATVAQTARPLAA